MSENNENKAMENNNSALQRPGSAAGMSPEIVEPKEKEPENKAPLQDIDSPFKAAPVAAGDNASIPAKAEKAAVQPETKDKKKSRKSKKNDAFTGMTEEEAEEEINKLHKRRKRRAAVLVTIVVLLIAGGILLPNLFIFVAPKVDVSNVNVNENTLQYRIAKTSINRELTASGSLSAGDTEDLKIAGDIEIEEFFVENGDVIKKGDKIASVSKPSVMNAIVETQKTLKKLDAKLNSINSADNSTVVKADSKARVKAIYIKKGSNAKDTISKNGALMLLSLDGLMAVDIDRTENTKLGDMVTVVLSNKTKLSGSIISMTDTYATCAISDKTAKYKDKVTVLDKSGKEIGSSELYIHNVLPVISYSGSVSKVSVKLNEVVKKGTALFTLTGTRYSGEFNNLMYKRSVLEDQMKYLFEVYQTGIIYSDHDGEVTGINDKEDEEEEDEDSDEKSSSSTSKLSAGPKKLGSLTIKVDDDSKNAPEGKATAGLINYALNVTGFSTSGGKTTYTVNASKEQPDVLPDIDYTNLDESITKRDQYKYTQQGGLIIDSSVPVYYYDKGTKLWKKESTDKIAMGDLLIVTFDSDGNMVWVIRYPQSSSEQGGGQGGQGGQGQGGQGQGGQGGWNGGQGGRGNVDWSSMFGGKGGNYFGGRSGYGYGSGAGTGTQNGSGETEEETYEMEETLVATIVNLDKMNITLTVDELDIININKTQEVDVTLDAIKGKSFKGKIISIDTDGTKSGTGNSKYSVKIELDRTDDMLTNMTASVRAHISTAEVISVPAEALIEKDNKTYVYTEYDKESDTLSGEVEVKTGISDGKNVEIVSGLNEGDQVWYKYAEGLVYRFVR